MIMLIISVIASVALCGCASHEDMQMYYDSIKLSAEAHERSVTSSDIAYVNAVSALKDKPMALLVLALTYKKEQIQVDYGGIYHPQGFVDGLQAATPLLNTGLMWGIGAWGLSEVINGASAVYNVAGNGRMAVDSNLKNSQNGYYGDTALLQSGVDVDFTGDETGDYARCLANPPAGFSDRGNAQYTPGCSCNTHYNRGGC